MPQLSHFLEMIREFGRPKVVRVHGGHQLLGKVKIDGDKISAVHCILASLVCDKPTTLHSVPMCGDVLNILKIASQHKWAQIRLIDHNSLEISPNNRPVDLMKLKAFRASICMTGALIFKNKKCRFSVPGGCSFSVRPIDQHLFFLKSCGFTVKHCNKTFIAKLSNSARQRLEFSCAAQYGPSVGVTCNALITALQFPGAILLKNCALEPVIGTLIQLIQAQTGRQIVRTARQIHISPRSDVDKPLERVSVTMPADATLLITLLSALAACGGRLDIFKIQSELPFLEELLDRWGFETQALGNHVRFAIRIPKHLGTIRCKPWPGIPSDVGPIIAASVAGIRGKTRVLDFVYPKRSSHIAGLCAMGYDIRSQKSETTIIGASPHSRPVEVKAPDIRAGAALLIGALGRNGRTDFTNLHQIFRGYAGIFETLNRLGANIQMQRDHGS